MAKDFQNCHPDFSPVLPQLRKERPQNLFAAVVVPAMRGNPSNSRSERFVQLVIVRPEEWNQILYGVCAADQTQTINYAVPKWGVVLFEKGHEDGLDGPRQSRIALEERDICRRLESEKFDIFSPFRICSFENCFECGPVAESPKYFHRLGNEIRIIYPEDHFYVAIDNARENSIMLSRRRIAHGIGHRSDLIADRDAVVYCH